MPSLPTPAITQRPRRRQALSPVWVLGRMGVPGWAFHTGALASMLWCVALWIRAKSVDQTERGHAERRALYVGLWTPTLYVIGTSLEPDSR